MATTTIDRLNGINSGVAIKAPCRAATTANITLSGEQTVDGIALVAGDRVLVKNQTSSINNGIYEVATSSWSRTPDFDGSNDVVTGTTVYVNFGTTYANTAWQVSTTGTILPGISACAWTQSSNLSGLVAALAALFPVSDAAALIKGSVDATKQVRFEADGISPGNTRVITVLDADITMVGTSQTQTLTNKTLTVGANTFSFTPITASLGANVTLNNTGNFFDGPSIAQGTAGTWFVSGTVSFRDTGGAAVFSVKLWDGTTLIASCITDTRAANATMSASLSGYITSPAGNIRISVKDNSATTGQILYNTSGESKDSTITAYRIA